MKFKRFLVLTFGILMMSGLLVGAVSASGAWPILPVSTVDLTLTAPVRPFPVQLTNVPVPSDVPNGLYTGWCIDLDRYISAEMIYPVYLLSSLVPPSPYDGLDWNRINYILNNKQGTAEEIQEAIWYFVNGGSYVNRILGPPPTALTVAMVGNATAYGGSFVPGPGEILAIICDPVDDIQSVIIEITVPRTGCEGLTPGFWKNHLGAWTGYTTGQLFDDVFGVDITIDLGKKTENADPTLLDALKAKGGVNEDKLVYDALARHAVAALLNAAHPDVDYPLTTAQIIEKVQYALGAGDATLIKNELESYNTLGAIM